MVSRSAVTTCFSVCILNRVLFPKNVEGRKTSGWILMDYGDVVVNVLTQEMREKYNIEKIWGDCELTEVE